VAVRVKTCVHGRLVAPGQPLTERELEVVRLAAEGLTDFEIGRRLFLSHHTIKSHVRSGLVKLDARSRAHATFIALRTGLID
jgi:DNA-binding CsgD family transcriptional regulator